MDEVQRRSQGALRTRAACAGVDERRNGEIDRRERVRESLARASRVLVETLDCRATLGNVANLLVPDWADWCGIDLLEPDARAPGSPGQLVNVAVAHVDPQKVERAQEMRRRFPPRLDDRAGAGYVARTGEPQCFHELDEQTLRRVAKSAEHFELLRELGLRSAVVVPLVARGRTLGAITLVMSEGSHALSEADVPHLQDLASRCALAVDNARLHERTRRELAQRERVERELRRSEAWFRQMVEGLAVGVYITDAEGRIERYNEEAVRLWGRAPKTTADGGADEAERFCGSFRIWRPDGGPQVPLEQCAMAGVLREGAPIRGVEVEIERPDGSRVTVLASPSPIHAGDGRVAGAVNCMVDITERKRAERELRQSEHRERERAAELETLMNAVPAVVFLAHDREGKRITGNRTAAEFLRLPIHANLSRTADEPERPGHFRVCRQGVELPGDQLPVQRAARGEAVESDEIEVRFDDGLVKHMVANATPLYDDAGAPRGAVAAMVDISERKRAEQALAASEMRERQRGLQQAAIARIGREALATRDLQALFDHAVHVVAETLCNEMCKVLELLPGGERLLMRAGVGFKPELVGHATVDTGLNSQAGYTLRSAEPVIVDDLRTETRFTGPPLLREHRVVSGMSVVIDGPDGKPWGVLGTHTALHRRFTGDDVNFLQAVANLLATAIQRHAIEQRLRDLNQTLEQRVAERTAEAEHRARQLQRMALELTHTEQRERRKLARILHDDHQQVLVGAKMQAQMLRQTPAQAVTTRADRLVELLDEAIQSSRTLSYELSPPSLHSEGLAAALRWLEPRKLEKYGLKLHIDADPAADPGNEGVRVLLFQLVRELLLNVVKHAQAEEAWVRMRRDAQNRLELIVEDHGRGFRVPDTWERHDDGEAGHGLSGMHQRLRLLDGELHVRSRPGDGTTVTIRVPLAVGKRAIIPVFPVAGGLLMLAA